MLATPACSLHATGDEVDWPTDRGDAVVPAADRRFVVAHAPGSLTFDGSLAVLGGSETAPAPSHTVADDEPRERGHRPQVELTTDPPDAGERDLDAGEDVTPIANAADVDGTVTSIERDVDEDGEYERPARRSRSSWTTVGPRGHRSGDGRRRPDEDPVDDADH